MGTAPATDPGQWAWRHAVVLAAASFLLYALGACRTIYVGDSGELVAAAATLGIPHPSGYPLYVLLGKLWTVLLPFGSIAWRMSLLSAACAAAATGGLYALGRRLGLGAPAALLGSLLLALGPSFWSQANIQRVYSLNALCLVAALATAYEWRRTDRLLHLVATFFLSALGACNHTFMGVFALVFALYAVASTPMLLRRPRQLLAAGGAMALGLLPYLYLPLRSRMNPRLDWGNPETLAGFRAVLLREDFWGRAWYQGPADLLAIAADYLTSLGHELPWGGLALAVLGLLAARRHGWPVALPLGVMAANFFTMALHGSRSDLFIWHRYYIPSYAIGALLGGMGLEAIARSLGARRRLAIAALALPLLMLISGYPRFDRSRYRLGEDFSRTLLGTLPPGAHLSATDDNILFVLMYLHLVEGLRPDVNLILQGVGDAELPALRFDPEKDPLHFTHHPNWSHSAIEAVPVGLTFRTVAAGTPWPEPEVPKLALDGEHDPRVPKDYLTRNLIGHFHYMLGITHEQRDWPRAAEELRRAAAAASDNDVLFYNLGLIYRRNGLAHRSLEAFERSRAINPRHIASNRPVRATDRLEEARREVERRERIERSLAGSLGDLPPGSAAHHRRLAELLEERGEPLAARGHRLLALEVEAGA